MFDNDLNTNVNDDKVFLLFLNTTNIKAFLEQHKHFSKVLIQY